MNGVYSKGDDKMGPETPYRKYIVVAKEEEGGKVLALGRRPRPRRCGGGGGKVSQPEQHWREHSDLAECFVHRGRSLRRALMRNAQWLQDATIAYPARYNSATEHAELLGGAVPFDELKQALLDTLKQAQLPR